MKLSPTFIIYRTGFAPTNGMSVQMQRLFGSAQEPLIHLMWDAKEAGRKSIPRVINTDDDIVWKGAFGRIGRRLQGLQLLLGQSWWKSDRFNSAKLARALSRIPLQPRQAYINCGQEWDAVRACALWEAAGQPPYVLHIVDIFEPELSQEKTPNFIRLVRAAKHVLCLTRIIENEMTRAGAVSTSVFNLCSDRVSARRAAPAGPFRVLISGALYKDRFGETKAMQLLREAWPELTRAFPGAELHYAGAASWGLPAELRCHVRDHGLLIGDHYYKLLNSCHLAYVPVSHANTGFGRFSLPSRIPEYLIAGLPVIACTTEGTGIYEFFQSTPRECTRLVDDVNEFLSTAQEFAGNADRWERASLAATSYSEGTFAVGSAQEELFRHLNAVATCKPMTTSVSQ
jgi:hypothetical protein